MQPTFGAFKFNILALFLGFSEIIELNFWSMVLLSSLCLTLELIFSSTIRLYLKNETINTFNVLVHPNKPTTYNPIIETPRRVQTSLVDQSEARYVTFNP